MSETASLSELIAEIYDAAIDPLQWPKVQMRVCSFVTATAATLYWQDSSGQTGNNYFQVGISSEYEHSYFQTYIRLNPLHPALTFLPLEQVHSTNDIMSLDAFCRTRFYKEWVRPQGLLESAFINLERSSTSSVLFSVIRSANEHQGLIDGEMRRRLGLIGPHIRRAALVGKVIELKRLEAAMLTDTLDALSAGMFIVDASSRMVHANANGRAILAEASVLRIANGKLATHDSRVSHELHDLFSAAGRGDAAVASRGVAMSLTALDGTRFIAHTLPLTSGERRKAGRTYAAAAALFVRELKLDLPSPLETAVKLYHLTWSEARVLQAVAQTPGVGKIADALGISQATVKTHLHHLFQKTGTARQGDLVKLMAALANP
jgi:DNA-binding CsgD family transcriptional regulator